MWGPPCDLFRDRSKFTGYLGRDLGEICLFLFRKKVCAPCRRSRPGYLINFDPSLILFFSPPCDQFILFYKSECPIFSFSVRRVTSLFYFISPQVRVSIIFYFSPPCDQFIFFYKSECPLFSFSAVWLVYFILLVGALIWLFFPNSIGLNLFYIF